MNHVYEVLLGWHEAFRKFGFTSDEIFVAPSTEPAQPIQCVVRAEGREASVTIREGNDWTEEGWAEATRQWNANVLDREAIYKSWLASTNTIALVTALMSKGFNSAALQNRPKWRDAEAARAA